MSSHKKGKKSKGTTVPLTEFIANTGGVSTVSLKTTSWAEDVEDEHESEYMSRSAKEPIVLPTAPRAARGPACDDENIPTSPPFVAYVSNLPYDVVEDDLADFFATLAVSNVRLPKDSTKLRGYGYVEFEDRASLIEALGMSNTLIKTRRVRIEVSNSSNDERRGGGRMGMGRDNRRDGYDDPERTSGDWRSGPREERDDRFRSRGGFDNRDRRDDRESSEPDRPGAWREESRSVSSFSDRKNYRDDNRRGGFRDDDRRGFRDDERRGGFRDDERRGFRGDDDRKDDKDWREGNTAGFGPRRSERERERERERDRERDDGPSEPRTRPTLNLLPRTKPIEPIMVKEEVQDDTVETKEVKDTKPAPTPVPAAKIFGAAKPVDTTAREREIEERLAKSQAEKAKTEEGESKGTWSRRNGEGRADREKEKPRSTWREEDRGRNVDRRQAPRAPISGRADHRGDSSGDSRGPPNSRSGAGPRPAGRANDARGPPERERRDKDKERERDGKEDLPMPKALDEQAPNFVASNKYSMLNEDVDTDVIDD